MLWVGRMFRGPWASTSSHFLLESPLFPIHSRINSLCPHHRRCMLERRRLLFYLPTATHHLAPSSSSRRGVVHGDCSGAAFFTAPSRLLAAILPLHYTRALLVGYHGSPPGRPCPPMTSCFKWFQVFQKYVFKCLSMLQWLYTHIASIYFKCFSCFRRMFQVFYLDVA